MLRQNIIPSGPIPSNSPDIHTQNNPIPGNSTQCQESAVKPPQCQVSAQEGSAVSNSKHRLSRLPAQILGVILLAFPVDMRTIISHLGIASKIHKRLCCPKCFCLYPMDNKLSQCSFRATPKSHICQASLSTSSHRKGDKTNTRPTEFAFQSLFEWLGIRCYGRYMGFPALERIHGL
ncbi:hypothetical protein VP01_1400g1 [Puccinia sorghi]|uniref:Uncharacterized protein n=1 Tax=Puccinia sorghi TaxID=27349 RepID=A0A0L6VKX8_9BASI|nr:hypothetical protein VP01_1400g1 [Puccinia sorghi]